MQQEIYAIIYNKIRITWLTVIFCKIIYFLMIVKYIIKKRFVIKQLKICNKPISSYRNTISKIYPKPKCIYEKSNIKDIKYNISIIIPIYNYKNLISICINSVLNQKTKYKYEIILVDDGSTDGASEIVDSYYNRDNIVIIHQKNKGIGGARNTGINNASGEYITFIDCDDYVHEDFIEKMLNEAYEGKNDIVICGYTLVKKEGMSIKEKRDIIKSKYNLINYKSPNELIMNYSGLPWNKIYKRSLFENIRYIEGFWYEDTIIHFLVFPLCKKFSYIPISLYDYMWYEKNFSHVQNTSSPKSLERYWLLEILVDEYYNLGLTNQEVLYKILLRHMGNPLFSGVKDFSDEIKEAVINMAKALLDKNKPDNR